MSFQLCTKNSPGTVRPSRLRILRQTPTVQMRFCGTRVKEQAEFSATSTRTCPESVISSSSRAFPKSFTEETIPSISDHWYSCFSDGTELFAIGGVSGNAIRPKVVTWSEESPINRRLPSSDRV